MMTRVALRNASWKAVDRADDTGLGEDRRVVGRGNGGDSHRGAHALRNLDDRPGNAALRHRNIGERERLVGCDDHTTTRPGNGHHRGHAPWREVGRQHNADDRRAGEPDEHCHNSGDDERTADPVDERAAVPGCCGRGESEGDRHHSREHRGESEALLQVQGENEERRRHRREERGRHQQPVAVAGQPEQRDIHYREFCPTGRTAVPTRRRRAR